MGVGSPSVDSTDGSRCPSIVQVRCRVQHRSASCVFQQRRSGLSTARTPPPQHRSIVRTALNTLLPGLAAWQTVQNPHRPTACSTSQRVCARMSIHAAPAQPDGGPAEREQSHRSETGQPSFKKEKEKTGEQGVSIWRMRVAPFRTGVRRVSLSITPRTGAPISASAQLGGQRRGWDEGRRASWRLPAR